MRTSICIVKNVDIQIKRRCEFCGCAAYCKKRKFEERQQVINFEVNNQQ